MTAQERIVAKSDRVARLLQQVKARVGATVWERLSRESVDSALTSHGIKNLSVEDHLPWEISPEAAGDYARFIRETVRPALLRDPQDEVIEELEAALRAAGITPVP